MTLRIASTAKLADINPYIRSFYTELSNHGVQHVGTFHPSFYWLKKRWKQVDALHFQWIDYLFTPRTGPRKGDAECSRPAFSSQRELEWRDRCRLQHFSLFLNAARHLGIKIVWTLHNLSPHEGAWPMQRNGYERLAAAADLIICHDEQTHSQCLHRFPTGGKVVVMHHGNYDGVYPSPRPRNVIRSRLGIDPSARVLTCLGHIREYKGIDIACRAISHIHGQTYLLIGGKPHPTFAAELRSMIEANARAIFVPEALSDQDFADYVAISDIILLPYRQVTGSGALLAALTLGRGVVASDLPFFRDMLAGHPDAGRLFMTGSHQSLAAVTSDYLNVPPHVRELAARSLADRYAWSQTIQPVLNEISSWKKQQNH